MKKILLVSVVFVMIFTQFVFAGQFGINNGNKYLSYLANNSNTEKVAGITFTIPKYYDVREENFCDCAIAYYPKTEIAEAMIGFDTIKGDLTSKQLKNSKDSVVEGWKESFGNDLEIDDYDIDGNYVLTMYTENEYGYAKIAVVVNDKEEKAAMLTLIVDISDASGNTYLKDFNNMIKKAYIPKKTTQNYSSNNSKKSSGNSSSNSYKSAEVGNAIREYNNEIDNAKNEVNNEIDKAADELKDEMGLAGKLFGNYIDDYVDIYKGAVDDASDIYKNAANEYGDMLDGLFSSFGY